MYTTCAFCNGKLDGDGGPSGLGVGRRLAFDEWKGRLWVICPKCSRWNLAPLEERWEKVEALGRAAREGRVAAATAQVALIRWRAYDLVQVGKPPRLELATWRYGERLKARRREQLKFVLPLTVAALGVAVAVNVAAGGAPRAHLCQPRAPRAPARRGRRAARGSCGRPRSLDPHRRAERADAAQSRPRPPARARDGRGRAGGGGRAGAAVEGRGGDRRHRRRAAVERCRAGAASAPLERGYGSTGWLKTLLPRCSRSDYLPLSRWPRPSFNSRPPLPAPRRLPQRRSASRRGCE